MKKGDYILFNGIHVKYLMKIYTTPYFWNRRIVATFGRTGKIPIAISRRYVKCLTSGEAMLYLLEL